MTVDVEKQNRLDDSSRRTSNTEVGSAPLALRRSLSRHTYKGGEKTLANKPDDVDAEVWLEASSVAGIKERKVRPGGPRCTASFELELTSRSPPCSSPVRPSLAHPCAKPCAARTDRVFCKQGGRRPRSSSLNSASCSPSLTYQLPSLTLSFNAQCRTGDPELPLQLRDPRSVPSSTALRPLPPSLILCCSHRLRRRHHHDCNRRHFGLLHEPAPVEVLRGASRGSRRESAARSSARSRTRAQPQGPSLIRHPCVQIADAAQVLCGGRRIGWYIGCVRFPLLRPCQLAPHADCASSAASPLSLSTPGASW